MTTYRQSLFMSVVVLVLLSALAVFMAGCNEQDVIYGRAVARLNEAAQQRLARGDAAGAIARLQAAQELNPSQVATLHNLAVAYQANAQYEQAAEVYQQLIRLEPARQGQYLQSLGIVYEEQGDKGRTEFTTLKEQQLGCTLTQDMVQKHTAQVQTLRDKTIAAYEQAAQTYLKAAPLVTENSEALHQQAQAMQQAAETLQKERIAAP